MTVLPAGAISITDGAIVIAAETVAPRLGLKPEALQAEMQRGQVCCLVETGVDEDEGRTRVTVRYHARSWTLVVEPDGNERATTWSASAIPLKTRATSSDRDQVAAQLRSCLQNMAAAGLTSHLWRTRRTAWPVATQYHPSDHGRPRASDGRGRRSRPTVHCRARTQ